MESDILIIKALVATKKGGMLLSALSKEYRDTVGEWLNFKKYGFRSTEEFIRSSPDLQITNSFEGLKIQVHDENMSHVTSLVNRQRDSKKRKKVQGFKYGQHSNFNRKPFNNSYMKGKTSSSFKVPQPFNYVHKTSSQSSYSKPLNYVHKTSSQSSTYSKPLDSKSPTKTSYPRTSCSFGAGDVRFLSQGEIRECNSSHNFREEQNEREVKEHLDPDVNKVAVTVSSTTSTKSYEGSLDCNSNSEDEFSPLMGIGRGVLRSRSGRAPGHGRSFVSSDTRKVVEQYSNMDSGNNCIGNDNVVDSCSSRVATFSAVGGLSVTAVFNSAASSSSSRPEDVDYWNDDLDPTICSHQLIGDDIAVRFAEETLDCKFVENPDNGLKSCGLCIENLTIETCCELIEKSDDISEQVLIMLGLTDVLANTSFEEMKRGIQRLIQLLKERNTTFPVFVTLPVLPCLRKYPKLLSTLSAFNKWLLSLKSGLYHFWVFDIKELLPESGKEVYFTRRTTNLEEVLSSEGAQTLYKSLRRLMM